MHSGQVLNSLTRSLNYQHFDPTLSEHLLAYKNFTAAGRQHPTMRFFLEEPYLDIPTMMRSKIISHHIDTRTDLNVTGSPVALCELG